MTDAYPALDLLVTAAGVLACAVFLVRRVLRPRPAERPTSDVVTLGPRLKKSVKRQTHGAAPTQSCCEPR